MPKHPSENKPYEICPCCDGLGVVEKQSVRSIKVQMFYDQEANKFRPLCFKNPLGEALDNLSDCSKTRKLFNFELNFEGNKWRLVTVKDLES